MDPKLKTYAITASCAANSSKTAIVAKNSINVPIITLGGTAGNEEGAGMTPLEASLGTLVACQASTARYIAGKILNIKIGAISFPVVEGTLDLNGFYTGSVPSHFNKVNVVCEVETAESKETIAKLFELVEKQCPLHSLMHAAHVEMNFSWSIKEPASKL